MMPDYEIRDRKPKRHPVQRKHIQPARRPPHPSVLVQREAEARGMSARQMQDALGWSDYAWDAFGKQTLRMFLCHYKSLANVFGISLIFWRNAYVAWRCWETPYRKESKTEGETT